ncbi:MAG TPA: methyltransferase domain-containing protein [Burkholderiaceae bacterium]|nr:methyltransferase domain-containing protein [Burkholderiaceae bacterium]
MSQDLTATGTIVSSQAFIQHVQALIRKGALQDAVQELNRAAHTAQNDPRLHILGMELAEASGNPQGALASAERAVRKSPEWAPGVMNLALLHARQNRFPEALSEAHKALALAPAQAELLEAAIQIAQKSGANGPLKEWAQQALSLQPDHTQHRLTLGEALLALGDGQAALETFETALASDLDNELAAAGRAHALLAAGRQGDAVAAWDALLARQPDNAAWAFHRAVAAGETPSAHPLALVKSTFDAFAPVYDMHMLRTLRYRLPKDVAERLLTLHPTREFHLLDLGCGTGLLGLMLGKIAGSMIGVDASLKMIEQAEKHGVYDRFHHVDLLDALRETPPSLYHVIAALDVFIYVGDLTQALADAQRILVPGGRMVFSCETAPEDGAGWVLQAHGRYAHQRAHVQALCQAAGFSDIQIQEVDLRMEKGVPTPGFLVEAVKPA